MTFEKLPPDVIATAYSETAKYRHLTAKYCYMADDIPGCGVDVASQGDRVVPWAVSLDLPIEEYNPYNSSQPPKGPIHIRGHAEHLPFESDSLNFVYSSHLMEDFLDWEPVMREWQRVLIKGGNLIILIPEKVGWEAAMTAGQMANPFHRHEGTLGEMSAMAVKIGMEVIEERMTNQFPGDYTIMGVFRKL